MLQRILLFLSLLLATPGLASASIVISEIRLDQPGQDSQEYFELEGPAGASLQGLWYVVLGDDLGACGSVECVLSLDGMSIPAGNHFLVAENEDLLPALVAPLNFENNDNVTHLLVEAFTGHLGQDLDVDDDGRLDVEPWTRIVDAVAISEGTDASCTADEYTYGDRIVGPDGHFAPGHVYLCGGTWFVGDFEYGVDDSPGQPNSCRRGPHAVWSGPKR